MTRYKQLVHFINEEMKMSQIYQPLMLIELLKSMDGKVSVKYIAQAILNKDPTQSDCQKPATDISSFQNGTPHIQISTQD